ncbi:MAG: dTDP-4-dehydrorhamnose 3,5-epimerase family protein [bacterium]|nr:dTDP-4-dehydrorhamnose 3,5-epimerase family protein [bacterium]
MQKYIYTATPLKVKGAFEIAIKPNSDERGSFGRIWDKEFFASLGLNQEWVQENHSYSKYKGTVRGAHIQAPPATESKMVWVPTGATFFVYVDLRKGSPTLGEAGSLILSAEKQNSLIIPRGIAIVMCTLTDELHLHYKMDNYFSPESERNIRWDSLGIKFPVETPTVISEKDRNAMPLKEFLDSTGGIDVIGTKMVAEI